MKSRLRVAFGVIVGLVVLTLLVPSFAMPPSRESLRAPRLKAEPTIPSANRTGGNRVILERADRLIKAETDSFMVVSGGVEFSKGPMLMFCDSAHYAPGDGSLYAFGNVRMEQGDTLFVYADELKYDGTDEIAYLYGYDPVHPVRMINRDVKLETDVFTYDMIYEIGFYNTYGILTDKKNRLVSTEGEYIPSTKDANFYENVVLTSLSDKDTLTIYTDTLFYNTTTHIAEFNSPTTIINAQGEIHTTDGTYNTETEYAELFAHSKVRTTRGTTLEGDTLEYDRVKGIGTAYGNMILTDSVRQSMLCGDYGYYDEIADSAFVTGHALAKEYSRGDTLYMHGRYITSILRIDHIEHTVDSVTTMISDTTHVITTWPRVRFYRSDMQGICDSMIYIERDSTLYMKHHPVVWSEERQIFGNIIDVHLNDSAVDRVHLPDFAFTARLVEDPFYDQLSGKKMVAFLNDGEVHHIDVDGNVQAIFLPEEEDSTINKMIRLETSFLAADMKDNTMRRMKTWPETSGRVTPLYLVKKSDIYLPKFVWYTGLRPASPEDVFIIPPEMDALMSDGAEIPSDNVRDVIKPDVLESDHEE